MQFVEKNRVGKQLQTFLFVLCYVLSSLYRNSKIGRF